MSLTIGGEPDGVDLRRFHGQFRRGLLMHRKGRLGLFFLLQFPQSIVASTSGLDVRTQLDVVKCLADEPPESVRAHRSYQDMVQLLTRAMELADDALAKAQNRQLDTRVFSALLEALLAFDRSADVLDSDVTSSLTDIDALTGLFNRAALDRDFRREAAKALRSGRPLTVAMVDADHFKKVNDTHGHDFGDVVLNVLAHRFVESLRPGDLVYRYGGEEFLVLLPDTDVAGAVVVLERLRLRACSTPITQDDIAVTQAVSIGVAPVLTEGDPEDAVLRADEALYQAKDQGRNRLVVAS
ncbi:MAG: GGDEF domain-containing protein [Rhodoferax sp.]|nr:GGDEF domain-containing protein [Rhodoferax sp.]